MNDSELVKAIICLLDERLDAAKIAHTWEGTEESGDDKLYPTVHLGLLGNPTVTCGHTAVVLHIKCSTIGGHSCPYEWGELSDPTTDINEILDELVSALVKLKELTLTTPSPVLARVAPIHERELFGRIEKWLLDNTFYYWFRKIEISLANGQVAGTAVRVRVTVGDSTCILDNIYRDSNGDFVHWLGNSVKGRKLDGPDFVSFDEYMSRAFLSHLQWMTEANRALANHALQGVEDGPEV